MYLAQSNLFLHLEAFNHYGQNAEVLVLGTSHAASAVNPEFMDQSCFNLAFGAQDLYYDYHLFQQFGFRMKNLKYLLISLDYFSFDYDESVISLPIIKDYYHEAGIMPRNGIDLQFLLSHMVVWLNRQSFIQDVLAGKRVGGFYGYAPDTVIMPIHFKLMAEHKPLFLLLSSGYLFSDRSMSDTTIEASARYSAKLHLFMANSKKTVENIQCLSRLIEESRARGINVILFSAPVSREYREALPSSFIANFHDNINNLRASYPGIPYLDFTTDDSYSLEMFRDADHLNYLGAEQFTKKLQANLRNME